MKNCPNSIKNNQTEGVQMFDCIEEFLTEKKVGGTSPNTLKTYRWHLNMLLNLLGGSVDMSHYDKSAYNLFYEKLVARGISSMTVKSYCLTVRVFSYWCMERGYCDEFKISEVKAQGKIKQTYTEDELKKLLKKPNLHKCTFTEYKVWVLENLVICTGLRIGSVVNIRVGDIDFDNNCIIINNTKNKSPFTTYFNKDFAKILKEYLVYRRPSSNNDYLICTNEGLPISRRTMQQEIAKYNKERGVSKTSIHLMRHTFAKNSIRSGVDVFSLMSKLQHKNINTTLNYLKELGLEIQDTVEIYNPQQLYSVGNRKITMEKGWA